MAFSGSYNVPDDLRELSREMNLSLLDPAVRVPIGVRLQDGVLVPTRPAKFSKRFRLTQDELDYLFPERTYADWLGGGAEKDALERDIHTQIQYEETTPSKEMDASLEDLRLLRSVQSRHAPVEHHPLESCAICLEDFEQDDMVRGLVCGHVFHKECVDPWLSNRKACCPLCKRDYYLRNRVAETQEGESQYALMSAEEVDRLREAERGVPESRRALFEIMLRRNGENGDQDALESMRAYQEYLQVLRPLRLRAQDILNERPELEQAAEAKVNAEYYTWRKRLYWKLVGVSKRDIINSVIVAMAEQSGQNGDQSQSQSQSLNQASNGPLNPLQDQSQNGNQGHPQDSGHLAQPERAVVRDRDEVERMV